MGELVAFSPWVTYEDRASAAELSASLPPGQIEQADNETVAIFGKLSPPKKLFYYNVFKPAYLLYDSEAQGCDISVLNTWLADKTKTQSEPISVGSYQITRIDLNYLQSGQPEWIVRVTGTGDINLMALARNLDPTLSDTQLKEYAERNLFNSTIGTLYPLQLKNGSLFPDNGVITNYCGVFAGYLPNGSTVSVGSQDVTVEQIVAAFAATFSSPIDYQPPLPALSSSTPLPTEILAPTNVPDTTMLISTESPDQSLPLTNSDPLLEEIPSGSNDITSDNQGDGLSETDRLETQLLEEYGPTIIVFGGGAFLVLGWFIYSRLNDGTAQWNRYVDEQAKALDKVDKEINDVARNDPQRAEKMRKTVTKIKRGDPIGIEDIYPNVPWGTSDTNANFYMESYVPGIGSAEDGFGYCAKGNSRLGNIFKTYMDSSNGNPFSNISPRDGTHAIGEAEGKIYTFSGIEKAIPGQERPFHGVLIQEVSKRGAQEFFRKYRPIVLTEMPGKKRSSIDNYPVSRSLNSGKSPLVGIDSMRPTADEQSSFLDRLAGFVQNFFD